MHEADDQRRHRGQRDDRRADDAQDQPPAGLPVLRARAAVRPMGWRRYGGGGGLGTRAAAVATLRLASACFAASASSIALW